MEKQKHRAITLDDRRKIHNWYINGDRIEDIAQRVSVNTVTMYREIKRGATVGADGEIELDANKRQAYDPKVAQANYMKNLSKRGRKRKEVVTYAT